MPTVMRPVQVEVIAPVPEGWGLCNSCEVLLAQADLDRAPSERGLEEYPAGFLADFQRLEEALDQAVRAALPT